MLLLMRVNPRAVTVARPAASAAADQPDEQTGGHSHTTRKEGRHGRPVRHDEQVTQSLRAKQRWPRSWRPPWPTKRSCGTHCAPCSNRAWTRPPSHRWACSQQTRAHHHALIAEGLPASALSYGGRDVGTVEA
jgi:hypothetical protein